MAPWLPLVAIAYCWRRWQIAMVVLCQWLNTWEEHTLLAHCWHAVKGDAHARRDALRLIPVQWRLYAVRIDCWSMRCGQEKHGKARREAWQHVHRDALCAPVRHACVARAEGARSTLTFERG